MAYQYPYGDTQQLNLAWFLDEFKALQEAWEQEKQGITGALDAEIARAEAALSGVIEARDQAAASAADALAYRNAAQSASQAAELSKTNAETARRDASKYAVSATGSAQNASNSAIAAGNSAILAESAKSTAIQQANAAVQASGAASGYAQSAGQQAANAAGSATAADGSATAAAGSATTAGEEADRAEAAADEVADSVTQIATNTSDISDLKESITQLIPIGNGFNKTTYSHSETTTIGSHTFMFPATIPAGTTIKITNTTTSATSGQTNNLQKASGGEVHVGNLSSGQSMILTLEFDCTGIRNYIGTTAWGVSVEFGGEIKAQIDKSTSDIATIKEHNSANDTLAIGTLSNGVYDPTNKLRITDLNYIPVVKGCIVNASISFCYAGYDSNKVYVGGAPWQNANNPLVINDDYSYILVVIRVNDAYEFTDADLVTYADAITITYPVNDVVLDLLEKSYEKAELPSYYDTQVNTVLSNIKQEMFDAGISGESFIFFSDPHWKGNRKRSPLICKTVIDNTQINKIVCGGDLINQSATKTDMIDTMLNFVDSFKDIAPFYVALGNHDTNDAQDNRPNQRFTKTEAYSLCQKQTDQIMTYGEPCYYYFDNPTTKTRFIVIDTGLETMTTDATQIAWLESVLADTESDWHIIVIAHITYNGYPNQTITTFFSTVAGILDTNNADNSKAKVEAVFSGHLHADANYTTTGGIPIVLIDCDGSATNSASGASAGTINENCVDAVVINYTTETIYCNRIGRGNSRTITY